MFCYCQNLFLTSIKGGKNPFDDLQAKFSDGGDYCWDWFIDYSLAKALLYSVPLSIILVNYISKTFLRLITKLNGY
jgi:hypothetical protein